MNSTKINNPDDIVDLEPILPIGPAAQRLAPIMFWLAMVYLLAVAGVIHRADPIAWASEPVRDYLDVDASSVTGIELNVLAVILVFLWPIFIIEAMATLFIRDPLIRRWPAIFRAVLVIIFPPTRLALIHPANGQIWLPKLGWRTKGKQYLSYLDRSTSTIMLIFAAMILPLLALQFSAEHYIEQHPLLQFAVDLATAAIWVAFACEFIVKSSVAPKFFAYAKARWLDAAIVLLPTLEFFLSSWAGAAPIMRLLRLQKVVTPQYLARMGRLYRLRGLLTKGWQAILAIEGLARLLGQTPQKRLKHIEKQIIDMEESLAELRSEANKLREQVHR